VTAKKRLLEEVSQWATPFEVILATTFTFEPAFFVAAGVLPAMAGLGSERPSSAALVRQQLGSPYVGVLQGGPSQGAVPGWIDRAIWDSPRLGLLHAKCLVAAGTTRIHCLITSANLTEASWRTNRETAAVFSCSRDGRGRHASKAVTVLTGLRWLAATRELTDWVDATDRLLETLPRSSAPTDVVWSGLHWPGTVLDRLPTGHVVTATSPFWPDEPAAAQRVIAALNAVAPKLRLVTRDAAHGELFEAPGAFVDALVSHAPGVEIAVASPTDTGEEATVPRRLHGKQVTVDTSVGPRSYIGSANVTVRGLALAPGANVELGIVVPVDGLVDHLGFRSLDPARRRDPQDYDAPELDLAEFVSGLALLHADRRLEIVLDPGAVQWTSVEVPIGETERPLSAAKTEFLLDEKTYAKVVGLPELLVRSQTAAAHLPVVLDGDAKYDVEGISDAGFDAFLKGFGATIGLNESEEEDGPGEPLGDSPPPTPPGVNEIRAVHRARDVIERLEQHERVLQSRLVIVPRPSTALVELWLRGPGGMVTLARHLRHAALDELPPAITPTAATFVLTEIDFALRRLEESFPWCNAPVRRARGIVEGERSAAAECLEPKTLQEIQRLRPRRRRA
jgi:hypothetical protein